MINYFEETLGTIKDSLNSLDPETVNELVNECISCINNGGKIIATGLGKNVPICEKFVGTLNSLGISAAFLHTNTAIHGDLGVVKSNDIVLLLSKSGNTTESVFLAEQIIIRNTNLWLLTFSNNCKLKDICSPQKTLTMNLRNEGDLWDIVPNNSTTIYLILLQYIAVELQKRMNISIIDFKHNHPGGGIGERLKDIEK
ncbi:MAG: SIS domain-containing protein [Clostridiales bacterium]|nr:SIS domain-containing protein [Clostridiales bacterium]